MSWSFNTGNRYHTQDTSYYCGAACAMMILHEIGVPYAALDQDDLYALSHNHNAVPGWGTDPYGLCYTLNARRPSSFLPNFFVVHKPTSASIGTQHVVYTLRHFKVSPAVLIYDGSHWNVVCGVQTDVDPNSGPYVIEGFWLNNPEWDWSLSTHSDSDTCGTSGDHGIANEFVTYSEWQFRFDGCGYDTISHALQWISVCDPTPPNIELPRGREARYHADGRAILPVDAVAGLARRGLEEYRVGENERGKILSAQGSAPGKPILVQRLDRPGEFYYVVPWELEGRISATIDIDARFGFFKSARLLSRPADSWLPGASDQSSKQAIARLIDGHQFDLPDEKGRFRVFPDTYCVPSTLVWKPCRQSWSPHLPFHHIVIGGTSLYVRVDGHVFTQLTSGRGV